MKRNHQLNFLQCCGGVLLILLVALPLPMKSQTREHHVSPGDSVIAQWDTTLALSFDTAATPWFHQPYWSSSIDSFTTQTGLLQPLQKRDNRLWIACVLIGALMIIGFVRVTFTRYLRTLLQSALTLKLARQLYEEQELTMPFSAFALNINFLLTISLLSYLLLKDYTSFSLPFSPFVNYAVILGIVTALYLLRYLSLKVFYFLFPHVEEVNFYNFHFFLLNKIAGLAVVPFLFLFSFSGEFAIEIAKYSLFIIGIVLGLTHYIRGFQISAAYWRNDVFHFFLYICTLEIAPSVVLYKSFDAFIL